MLFSLIPAIDEKVSWETIEDIHRNLVQYPNDHTGSIEKSHLLLKIILKLGLEETAFAANQYLPQLMRLHLLFPCEEIACDLAEAIFVIVFCLGKTKGAMNENLFIADLNDFDLTELSELTIEPNRFTHRQLQKFRSLDKSWGLSDPLDEIDGTLLPALRKLVDIHHDIRIAEQLCNALFSANDIFIQDSLLFGEFKYLAEMVDIYYRFTDYTIALRLALVYNEIITSLGEDGVDDAIQLFLPSIDSLASAYPEPELATALASSLNAICFNLGAANVNKVVLEYLPRLVKLYHTYDDRDIAIELARTMHNITVDIGPGNVETAVDIYVPFLIEMFYKYNDEEIAVELFKVLNNAVFDFGGEGYEQSKISLLPNMDVLYHRYPDNIVISGFYNSIRRVISSWKPF